MEPHIPVEPVPDIHRIGAALALAAWFIVFRRAFALAPSRPHSHERLIFAGYCLIAAVRLAYAWGALMAFVARAREWTPRSCRSSGYPLLLAGMFATYLTLVGGPHLKGIANATGLCCGVLAADLAGRICRRLAFPELGWRGNDPAPPSFNSISPANHPPESAAV